MPRTMIQKASGEMEVFSEEKLHRSLETTGVDHLLIDEVVSHIAHEVHKHQTKTTKEIYARASAMLKSKERAAAGRYALKRALFALGPGGLPFQRYVARLFASMGYADVRVNQELHGACVTHNVDVVLAKGSLRGFAECVFYESPGTKCDLKVPLYVLARFQDIFEREGTPFRRGTGGEGWVVTNTHFTRDALAFATCAGLKLMGWNVGPLGESIERLVSVRGLHPVTCLTTLTVKQKAALLHKDVVLCKDLFDGEVLKDELGLSKEKRERTMQEARELCKPPPASRPV